MRRKLQREMKGERGRYERRERGWRMEGRMERRGKGKNVEAGRLQVVCGFCLT